MRRAHGQAAIESPCGRQLAACRGQAAIEAPAGRQLSACRGQAAMEFLMTYGWALIIVLVVVAALFYAGVFNTNSTIPKSCTFPAGFTCEDYDMDSAGNLFLDVGQATGRSINITGMSCGVNASNPVTTLPQAITLPNNMHSFITNASGFPCAGATAPLFKGKVTLTYTTAGSGLTRNVTGDLTLPLNGNVTNSGPGTTATQISQANVPLVINSPGNYYLSENVSCSVSGSNACILISTSNVTLDCQSYSITSPCCGGVHNCNCGMAVYLYNVTGVTVANCKATGFVCGVQAENTTWSTISGGNFYTNGYHGIYLLYGGNNTLSGNILSGNKDHGISMTYTLDNQVLYNNISSSTYRGISVWNSSHNTFIGNRVPNYNYFGIELTDGCWNTTLVNNTACGSSPDLQCYDSSYSILNASGNICASENCANLSCSAGC